MGIDWMKWALCVGFALAFMGLLLGMMHRSIRRDNERYRRYLDAGGHPEFYDELDNH